MLVSIKILMKYILITITLLTLAACGGGSSSSSTSKNITPASKLPDQVTPNTTLSKAEVEVLRSLKLTAAPVDFVMPKAIAE